MQKRMNVIAKAGLIFSLYIIARKAKQTSVDKQVSRNSPAAKQTDMEGNRLIYQETNGAL